MSTSPIPQFQAEGDDAVVALENHLYAQFQSLHDQLSSFGLRPRPCGSG